MTVKRWPVESVTNPPSVENLSADVVALAEAQSLRHQTLQLPVAEPLRGDNYTQLPLQKSSQKKTGDNLKFQKIPKQGVLSKGQSR